MVPLFSAQSWAAGGHWDGAPSAAGGHWDGVPRLLPCSAPRLSPCWVAPGGGGRRAAALLSVSGDLPICVALTLSKRVLCQGRAERDQSLFGLSHLLAQPAGQNALAVARGGAEPQRLVSVFMSLYSAT